MKHYSRKVRQATSIFDQCTHAGIAMGCMVGFGRWLDVDEFGALMAGYAIWFLAESLQRSAILIPSIISISQHGESSSAYSAWFRIGFLTSIAAAVVTLSGWVIADYFKSEYWCTTFISGAAFTLVGCVNSLVRKLFFHSASYLMILIGDVIALCAFTTIGAMLLLEGGSKDMATGLALAIYTGLFSITPVFLAISGSRLILARPLSTRSVLSGSGIFIAQLSAGSLAQYFYNNGVQLLVAVFSTPVSVAAFSASRTIARPIFIVTSAYSDAERSQAAKRYSASGASGLDELFWPMMRTLLILFGPALLIFSIAAPWLMHVAFDGKYDNYSIHAVLWVVALAPQIFAFPSDIILTTRGDSKHLMRSRFEAAAICVAFIISSYTVNSDVSVGWAITSIIAARTWLLVRNSMRYAATRTSTRPNEN
ncbi:lipopolysaccharide biosynthesis protein [Stenotrophomonas maltophilia]|uniref:lipopolysaccharide biosynthesis protein n=1 Tax=Stenotrophomonas maltophilia TaxID=40324 RepID=UPI0012F963FA|nr:hypothetical protein [Stenotrophomonas maltophilia]